MRLRLTSRLAGKLDNEGMALPAPAKSNPYTEALRRLRPTFIVVILFSSAVNLLMLTGPMFMLQLYDRVLSSRSVATLQGLFVIVVFAYVFLALYDLLRTRLLSRAAYRLDMQTGSQGFDRWIRSGVHAGVLPRRPLHDLANVRSFIASPGMLGFFDLPWMPLYLIIVYIIHPWLGHLALAGAVVVILLALANQLSTRGYFSRAMTMDSAESLFVDQAYRTSDTLVPLGMAGKIRDHWRKMHVEGLATGQTGGERTEAFAAYSKAFRLLLQSAILGLGGYLALRQEITPGMIVAASIIAGRALAPVDQVIGQWRSVIRAREAHKRLKGFMDSNQEQEPRVALPEPKGHLAVRSLVKFSPNQKTRGERPPILSDISFQLRPGDGLGVIGPSASGKSSLARVLIGGWKPDVGEVRLDGATLDQWDPDVLGQHLGYLPQSLELLTGTVRDNIVRFDSDATDEKLIEAARIAGVHEMVLNLPDGYNTRIGFAAAPLSGGQIQRIGLARAVYGMPKLVVLDEPNSNLDAEGDEALARAILHMRQAGSTVVVMAHRPSAISAVNKLIVLNGGRMTDFGEKADVLKRATRAAPAPASQTVAQLRPSVAEDGHAG